MPSGFKVDADKKGWRRPFAAERGGPTMLARIGIMRALNRHVERVFELSGKKHHWGRRKLARDR